MPGAACVLLIVGAFLALSIQAAFLLWAAGLLDIRGRSFSRALGVALLGDIVSAILSPSIQHARLAHPFLASVAGFLVMAVVMMPIFNTTFGKALGASVLAWFLSILVAIAILVLLAVVGGAAVLQMGR